MQRIIKKRIYVGAEGKGEQSFVKWLQLLLKEKSLPIHLDCVDLAGGGYKSLLAEMLKQRKNKERSKAKGSILLLDRDREDRGDDGCSLKWLQREADKNRIRLCVSLTTLSNGLTPHSDHII